MRGDRSLCSGTAISCPDAAATALSVPDAAATAISCPDAGSEAAVTALSVPDAAATAISCPDAAATALSVPDAAVTAIPVPDAAVTAIPVPDAAVTAIPVPDAAATAISVPDAAVTALVVLEAAVTALSVPDATVTADVPLVARPAHLRVSFDESMAAGGFEDTSVQPYHFEPESDPERDDAPKKFGNYGLDRTYLNALAYANDPRPYSMALFALQQKYGQPHQLVLREIKAILALPRQLLSKLPTEHVTNFARYARASLNGQSYNLINFSVWLQEEAECQAMADQELKVISPGFSRQAFAKLLEHRTKIGGRMEAAQRTVLKEMDLPSICVFADTTLID
ncbi:pheromone-regulated PRM7-like protein [Labeo rohita]|uniref:Pheromone-regulated PRM7-like protein n=1 Tax=Labeo rohita TaxID=84645 RepID=A0A498MCG1_LABRO|nr:pheromone-regulated PRM7-like protein [Labeo rohita]